MSHSIIPNTDIMLIMDTHKNRYIEY